MRYVSKKERNLLSSLLLNICVSMQVMKSSRAKTREWREKLRTACCRTSEQEQHEHKFINIGNKWTQNESREYFNIIHLIIMEHVVRAVQCNTEQWSTHLNADKKYKQMPSNLSNASDCITLYNIFQNESISYVIFYWSLESIRFDLVFIPFFPWSAAHHNTAIYVRTHFLSKQSGNGLFIAHRL